MTSDMQYPPIAMVAPEETGYPGKDAELGGVMVIIDDQVDQEAEEAKELMSKRVKIIDLIIDTIALAYSLFALTSYSQVFVCQNRRESGDSAYIASLFVYIFAGLSVANFVGEVVACYSYWYEIPWWTLMGLDFGQDLLNLWIVILSIAQLQVLGSGILDILSAGIVMVAILCEIKFVKKRYWGRTPVLYGILFFAFGVLMVAVFTRDQFTMVFVANVDVSTNPSVELIRQYHNKSLITYNDFFSGTFSFSESGVSECGLAFALSGVDIFNVTETSFIESCDCGAGFTVHNLTLEICTPRGEPIVQIIQRNEEEDCFNSTRFDTELVPTPPDLWIF